MAESDPWGQVPAEQVTNVNWDKAQYPKRGGGRSRQDRSRRGGRQKTQSERKSKTYEQRPQKKQPASRLDLNQPWDQQEFQRGRRPARNRNIRSRSSRFGKNYVGQVVKVQRRKFLTNKHQTEVIYNEADYQIDLDAINPNSHLKDEKSWEELGLPDDLVQVIYNNGFQFPSKVQSISLQILNDKPNESLIAQAPNGAGKTGSFIINSLTLLDRADPSIQVLCISHTLELANQNYNEYCKFTAPLNISCSQYVRRQNESDAQVISFSSGMFLSWIRNQTEEKLRNLKAIVVDEADHLFDKKDQEQFYNAFLSLYQGGILSNKLCLMYSATYSADVTNDIMQILEDANFIRVKDQELNLDNITHYYVQYENQDKKLDKLMEIVQQTTSVGVIFINTCNYAENVWKRLSAAGYKAALLMGRSMSVNERNLTMEDFRAGKFNMLITTNLLARGIDNVLVKWVVNFDLPQKRIEANRFIFDPDTYLHRSGRTGRFGRTGICMTLVNQENSGELDQLNQINETFTIHLQSLDNLEIIGGLTSKVIEDEDEEEFHDAEGEEEENN